LKPINLPANERDKLLALRHTICERADWQNEQEQLFADLTGLFLDITREISAIDSDKSLLIFDYAKLLGEEIQLHSDAEAYIIGYQAEDVSVSILLMGYLLKKIEDRHPLENGIQKCFSEISMILGKRAGLLADFTKVYRTVHGAISMNIHEFIELGQQQRRMEEIT